MVKDHHDQLYYSLYYILQVKYGKEIADKVAAELDIEGIMYSTEEALKYVHDV
jgi:hypothetical protein